MFLLLKIQWVVIQDQMTIQVIVKDNEIWVPTTFSPNGDRINDLFYPKFKFPEKSRITVFKIYDRWGEEVFRKPMVTLRKMERFMAGMGCLAMIH